MEAEKNEVVRLHKKSWLPVDWDEVEAGRKAEYLRISRTKLILATRSIRPVPGDTVWMMEMLDRFGGEDCYGNRRGNVKRTKKKLAPAQNT